MSYICTSCNAKIREESDGTGGLFENLRLDLERQKDVIEFENLSPEIRANIEYFLLSIVDFRRYYTVEDAPNGGCRDESHSGIRIIKHAQD